MFTKKGILISFEGGDGVGKSTQINFLSRYLRSRGLNVLLTREPGGTYSSEIIRKILLNNSKKKRYDIFTECILITIARIDHLKNLIIPALKSGKIVLCDRFIDSTRVYQGEDKKLPKEYLKFLEFITIGNLLPDLTFIFDLSSKERMKRLNLRYQKKKMNNFFDKSDIEIQEKRRQEFLKIAKQEPNRCHVINAEKSIKDVFSEIINVSKKII